MTKINVFFINSFILSLVVCNFHSLLVTLLCIFIFIVFCKNFVKFQKRVAEVIQNERIKLFTKTLD